MAKILVDGVEHEVAAGENVLQTCLQLGYDLPYFCWHPALGSVGACRQCAVTQFADQKDERGRLVMGCMTPVVDGMRLSLRNAEATEFRAGVIELLMTNHPHDCPVCEEGGECHLQDMTLMTGHHARRYRGLKRTHRNQDLGPFINHEMNRCIACYRCTRFYREYAGGHDLQVQASASRVYFGRAEDGALENAFSGNLVEVCPTGVFTDRTFSAHYTRKWDLQTAPSVCPHCAVGCNVTPGEREGTLRRVQNRYNSAVNGYFLCDRGRYGWQHVAADDRVRSVLDPPADGSAELPAEAAMQGLDWSLPLIGIGSPRASLESNFALRTLVGEAAFSMGVNRVDRTLLVTALDILRTTTGQVASLDAVEAADAVLILGEDLLHSAPRLALSVRQATRNAGFAKAEKTRVPGWQDQSVRVLAGELRSPLLIVGTHASDLDPLASATLATDPAHIESIAQAIAHGLDRAAGRAPKLPPAAREFAEHAVEVLQGARNPLVISGTSLRSASLLEATANIVHALDRLKKKCGISLVLPECNSLGVAALGGNSLEAIAEQAPGATLVVLENDLQRRLPGSEFDRLLDSAAQVIVIDHYLHATALRARRVLPAAAFGEADGTLVSSEARAQRFFQAFIPAAPIQESWRWLVALSRQRAADPQLPWMCLDEVTAACADAFPFLAGIRDAAPGAEFRMAGLRIPRQPHRYSGRTALNAAVSVHEPRPPEDPDSPLSWSMEGYPGPRPAALIASTWSPSWNSVQSLNKFQDEIGGALSGGDAGVRLIETNGREGQWYAVGQATDDKSEGAQDEVWVVARAHIFQSEELSARGAAIRERQSTPECVMNPLLAANLRLQEGEIVHVELADGKRLELPLRIEAGVADQLLTIPQGWDGAAGLALPTRGRVGRAGL